MGKWTQSRVDALRATDKPQRHPIGDGLALVITKRGKFTAGTKTWVTRYQVAGTTKQVALGTCDTMKLAEAVVARGNVKLAVRDGRDPLAEADAARTGRQVAAVRTVEVEARAWHAMMAANWMPSYARQLLQRLEAHVFPVIGRTPIGDVTRSQVVDLLAACRDRSAFQADHVRQHLVLMFKHWLWDREWITRNPVDQLAHVTKPPRKTRQPRLTDPVALRAALAKFEASSAAASMKLLNRFQALTGVRPSEARLAEWCEFAVPGQWRIPAEHMKGRQGRKLPHTVLLSPEAMEVVEVARAIAPAGAVYVFPSRTVKHRPIARASLADRLKATLGSKVQTAHGYRGSLTTILSRRGHAEKHIEMMLAHDTRGESFRHYDDSVVLDYAETLAPIWREWAQLLLADAPTAWSLAGLPAPVLQLRRAA